MPSIFNLIRYSKIDPVSGCLVWTGCKDKDGYGKVTYLKKTYRVPRLIYEDYIGPIPPGLMVLHNCNNGHLGCIEPTHLYAGTHRDNMNDMVKAGSKKGIRNPAHKLTPVQVKEIRDPTLHVGWSNEQIGNKYGVTKANIGFILKYKIWK